MFDFAFFQNDVLINEIKGLSYEEETFVTKDISYNHKDKVLTRITADYNVIIDFKSNELILNLISESYKGSLKLIKGSIKEKDNTIEILYQIDKGEPENKIIIRRNYER